MSAYEVGKSARFGGQSIAANPYPLVFVAPLTDDDTPLAVAPYERVQWYDGWVFADLIRRGESK